MALFQKLQRTVCKLTRPVVQKVNTTELALSEEDEETCDYAGGTAKLSDWSCQRSLRCC